MAEATDLASVFAPPAGFEHGPDINVLMPTAPPPMPPAVEPDVAGIVAQLASSYDSTQFAESLSSLGNVDGRQTPLSHMDDLAAALLPVGDDAPASEPDLPAVPPEPAPAAAAKRFPQAPILPMPGHFPQAPMVKPIPVDLSKLPVGVAASLARLAGAPADPNQPKPTMPSFMKPATRQPGS